MKKRIEKKTGSVKAITPLWQRPEAHKAPFMTLLHSTGGHMIADADPYDSVLRTSARRLAQCAGDMMFEEERPLFAATLLREAALMLDLLRDRHHAKDAASEARNG